MKRRDFMKNSMLASSAFMVPNFLRAADFGKAAGSRSGKTLVVVQLSGGNDGLNTIIPFRNDIYYESRPKIHIPKNEVLKLGNNNNLGFHPAMEALRPLFNQGQMSIINNVGYPNPNHSHFRSMDIWQTGSGSNEYLSTGWLGRYLDNKCNGTCDPYYALNVEEHLNLALKGNVSNGFAVKNIQKLNRTAGNKYLELLAKKDHDHEHENVEYLYKTMIDTQSSAKYLFEKSKVHKSPTTYPQSRFSKDMKMIAELMTADTDTKIYYATLSGFDTHANQLGSHEKLLKTYAESMKAFISDLKKNRLFNDTLIMTFSEFGRRVGQNAGQGTDHGTANNLFLMGKNLKKPGFYNDGPDLSNLHNGDLKFEIDFRRVYADVLTNWLDANSRNVLGDKFSSLGVI
jgi:uncharacterized protein (DUF1501 family)